MNQALKHRLIGLLVLIAIGVIFLPELFHGGRPRQIDAMPDVPPAPTINAVPLVEPKPVAELASEPKRSATDVYALAPKEEKEENPAGRPVLDAHGLPNAWVLQVGVFSDADKAKNLKQALQAKGYHAFTRSLVRDNKPLVRVLIGPELDKQKLLAIKTSVDRDAEVKSRVVKFEP